MPDSLHNTPHTSAPVSLPVADPVHAAPSFHDDDAELLMRAQQAVGSHHAAQPPARTRTPRQQLRALPDSLAADSTAADTVKHMHRKGVILVADKGETARMHAPRHVHGSDVASWIILGMLMLFLLVAARMRRNFKYLKILALETVSARSRQNMFVDTMRERAFSALLNVLCVVSAGILLAQGASLASGMPLPAAGAMPRGLWACLGISTAFYSIQWIAYLCIGHIFTARPRAHLWLQGFNAITALPGLLFFPLVLLSLFEPQARETALYVALGGYLTARLLFVFKGIRIFCASRTYYINFLYYLCSVEIVPLLLVWRLALATV